MSQENPRRFTVVTEKLSVFSESDLTDGVWIQAAPTGNFEHPVYGDVSLDNERITRFINHFNANVYGQDLPIFYEHFGMDASKGLKAAGWVIGMEQRDASMWWKVKFTPEATQEIKNGEWKYFSAEWYNEWTDPESKDGETRITYKDVASGGALTNQPFYKNMVPLNFSELAAEVASLPATNEVADWEHSEPATGPTPRRDNDDGDESQGTRGTSPDVTPPEQDDVEDSMKELLEKLGELLKLEGEPTEESVLAAFTERINQTDPLIDALDTANKQQTFSEVFPAEFARMQAQDARIREDDAKAFSERYANARVVKVTGDGDEATTEDTPFGFSSLAVEKIKDMHLAFSEGKLTETHISDVLDSVLNNGMVDYSERGTSRTETEPANDEDAKLAFAEKVREVKEQDKLDGAAAIRVAQERFPELARHYAAATRTKR